MGFSDNAVSKPPMMARAGLSGHTADTTVCKGRKRPIALVLSMTGSRMVMKVTDLDIESGFPDFPDPGPEPDLRADKERVFVEEEDMVFVGRARRGRPKKLASPDLVQRVVQLYFVERLSMRKIADNLGVSHMSVYRMLSDPGLKLLL